MKKRILSIMISFCMIVSSLSLPTGIVYASELPEATVAGEVEATEETKTIIEMESETALETELTADSIADTECESAAEVETADEAAAEIESEVTGDSVETFLAEATEETETETESFVEYTGETVLMNQALPFTVDEQIYGMSAYGLNGILNSGNYVKWIDRINIPSYAKNFYNTLAEASDNDGAADWLIDITKGKKLDSDTYGVSVTSFSVSASLSQSKFDQAVGDKFDEIGQYIFAVADAFDCDYPEVFWLSSETRLYLDGQYNSSKNIWLFDVYYMLKFVDSDSISYDVRSDEYQNTSKVKQDISKRDTAVNTILSGATGTYYDKIKYFNSTLTKNNAYLTGADNIAAHKCLGALLGQKGIYGPVCEGYARAFKVLCDKAKISCALVTGNAGGEAHMWNVVQVCSKWYAVDVTWNDPVFNGYDTDGTEDYLLVGSDTDIDGETFNRSHQMQNGHFNNGIAFTNGPILNSDAYVDMPEIEHTPVAVITKATTSKDGAIRMICDGCGAVVSTTAIPYPKTITLSATSVTYNGKEQKPSVKVTGSDDNAINSSNYKVTYSNYINQGTATATITFSGKYYTGSINKDYTIKKANNTIKASDFAKTYSSGTQTFYIKPSVSDNAKLSYSSNNKNIKVDSSGKVTIGKKYIGKATITIKSAATDKYNAGSKQITVTVNPTGTKLTGFTDSKDGKAVVKWNKNTVGSGYEIQYGTSSSFSKIIKSVTISKNSTTQTTLSGMADNTKYYVRIRTYKSVGKQKYYSVWSSSRNITVSLSPAKVSLASVNNSSAGKLVVKWAKNSKASGYEIQYSTDSQFKIDTKTVNVSSCKTTSSTLAGFEKGAKYYMRIRSYKTVGRKKYYAGWSSVKNVVITK